ncbi:hypothetical protein HRJ45_24175 [Vibrio coralliilyticus]|uniref:hypothetical protein n=1 Tax=Vibrio coralliilyticus TaxID=190893 RepID=UPI0015617C99|nr:hypothetical protein [Vibrio coralliilyticus]NRF28086.1 hypothetical protein [Vibrio coralliilyticus]NRF82210.1 hypothetical protein [Vibrio coralliilyticus]
MSENNFSAISQMVTEARHLLDNIKGGAISAMQTAFDNKLVDFTGQFNTKLSSYQTQLNAATASVVEVINGRNVHRVGDKKVYAIQHLVKDGGYQAGANIDPAFPNVKDPSLPISYFNLIEFVASDGFGSTTDRFTVDFYQTHRGMNSSVYVDHFVFTGSSSVDSVSGYLEVKAASEVGGLALFISQPGRDREVEITKDLVGKRIPISLRDIGLGVNHGTARLSIKADTRHYAGAPRCFYLRGEYSSSRGQPPAKLYNANSVHWSR